MDTHRSFAEQARHYFVRPATGPCDRPLDHPAAWRGDELAADRDRWLVDLDAEQIEDLRAVAGRLLDAGVPMAEVSAADFSLPSLDAEIERWRAALRSGSGVVCVRGLPVRDWPEALSAYAFWGLGHRIGTPGAQNPEGELLGHVKDYGESSTSPMVRKYRGAGDIGFHCDAADVVGLLCLRAAKEGGQSRIASSVTVWNEVLRQQPDLAAELFEAFDIDRRDEQPPGEPPTFALPPCAWDGSALRTFWHSDYMRSAARHTNVDPSERRRALIDLYDRIAGSEGVHLDMWLEPGDMQFISNHSVIHARTGYVDHEDPAERRHLLRLWLSLD